MTLDDMRSKLEETRIMFTHGQIDAVEYADELICIRRSYIIYRKEEVIMKLRDHLDEAARRFPLGTCVHDTDPENPFWGWVVGWSINGWYVSVNIVGGKGNHQHYANPASLKTVSRADVDRANGVRS